MSQIWRYLVLSYGRQETNDYVFFIAERVIWSRRCALASLVHPILILSYPYPYFMFYYAILVEMFVHPYVFSTRIAL